MQPLNRWEPKSNRGRDFFSLRIANSPLLASQTYVADSRQLRGATDSWERSIRLQGGYWLGKFNIYGELTKLNSIFNNWLGYDVTERQGGVTWEGLIYGMELHHNIVRERKLDNVYNAIKTFYGELLENSGFETLGAGPPTFYLWSENITGGDAILNETTLIGTGTKSLRITHVTSGNTYVYQTVTVEPNTPYRVSFYSRGDITVGGRYRIYDATNAADIVGLTATDNITEKYRKVENDIITPNGCTSLTLYLIAPSASGTAWFDDASIRLLIDERLALSETDFATQDQSIARYGRKELILDGKELTPSTAVIMRDTELGKVAWPKTERTSRGNDGEPFLTVFCCGYIFTAGWIYTAIRQFGSTTEAASLVSSLLAECQFIQNTVVKTNTTAIRLDMNNKRVSDALKRVVEVGDSSGNLWRLHMTANKTAVYEQISMTPTYVVKGRNLYRKLGDKAIEQVRSITPAVVRDYDWPVSGAEQGSIYQDQRDFLMNEVTVSKSGLQWSIYK